MKTHLFSSPTPPQAGGTPTSRSARWCSAETRRPGGRRSYASEFFRCKAFSIVAVIVLAACIAVHAQAPAPLEIRLATILPRGLAQDAVLRKLAQDWRKSSGGSVLLQLSPGGQKDGEAGIVRKLRSANYQAALLSAVGLSEIDPEVAALQKVPLTFENWEEVDFVREKIRSRLEQGLLAKGFVLLFWADSGWVNFFSTKRATTPAELKRMKLWVWAGEAEQVEIMKSLGYQPVALETDNLHSGFATGMIEAAPIASTFALGLQIHTVAPHVLDINWAPIVGAAIIRKDQWDKIPPALRDQLQSLCDKAGAEIRAEGRRFHQDAINTLRKGPKSAVCSLTPEERAQWQKLARELEPRIRGGMVPAPIYDEVKSLLKEYRAGKAVAVQR
jgi:TRAP-type C4-dicarboxylate transport system substrate-binding protein